jgi:hypothetical protein
MLTILDMYVLISSIVLAATWYNTYKEPASETPMTG